MCTMIASLVVLCFISFASFYQAVQARPQQVVEYASIPAPSYQVNGLTTDQVKWIKSQLKSTVTIDARKLWDKQLYADLKHGWHNGLLGDISVVNGGWLEDRYGNVFKLQEDPGLFNDKIVDVRAFAKRSFLVQYESGIYGLYDSQGYNYYTSWKEVDVNEESNYEGN